MSSMRIWTVFLLVTLVVTPPTFAQDESENGDVYQQARSKIQEYSAKEVKLEWKLPSSGERPGDEEEQKCLDAKLDWSLDFSFADIGRQLVKKIRDTAVERACDFANEKLGSIKDTIESSTVGQAGAYLENIPDTGDVMDAVNDQFDDLENKMDEQLEGQMDEIDESMDDLEGDQKPDDWDLDSIIDRTTSDD